MALPEHLVRLAKDCDVIPYKSSGPGGQKKNKTESSVRVIHRPTGLIRIATESRSQIRNREMALQRLWDALERRARKPKPRRATKPSRGSVERRLEEKRRLAVRKADRHGDET
jgi:protein subunit release factor B